MQVVIVVHMVWGDMLGARTLFLLPRRESVEIKNMIDLVLVKRDMLQYVQDMRVVRGMGCILSVNHVILCKVRLVGAWIKRREVVVGARRIRSEKLRNISTEKDMLGLLRGRE